MESVKIKGACPHCGETSDYFISYRALFDDKHIIEFECPKCFTDFYFQRTEEETIEGLKITKEYQLTPKQLCRDYYEAGHNFGEWEFYKEKGETESIEARYCECCFAKEFRTVPFDPNQAEPE